MKKTLLFGLIFLGLSASAQINLTASGGTATAVYPTLKDAFDAINAGTHQGNINLSITANTTETATAVLNAVTTYTSVTIKPTVAVTVGGAVASNPLIRILGSNVTIDGSSTTGGTTRDLTFSNTATTGPSVIFMGATTSSAPLTNVTLKNSVLINGSNGSTNLIIANGTTAAGFFNNITVQNNDIRVGFNGIYFLADTTTAGNGNNTLITGNTVNTNILQNGIFVAGIGGVSTISNNVVGLIRPSSGTTANPAPSVGISLSAGTNNASVYGNTITAKNTATSGTNYATGISVASGASTVSTKIYNNTISEISGVLAYVNSSGIYLGGATPNVSIYSNKISGLKNTGAVGNPMQGIVLGSSATAANTLVYNNVISDVLATGAAQVSGIYAFSGAGYKVYNNTVNLNTSNAETGISAAFYVHATNITTTAALDIRNNIFVNKKTSGSRFSIYSAYANNSIFGNINYNDYFNSGTALGFIGSNRTTLADIQTGFGGNVNSLNISPVFVSATDFHLSPSANPGLNNTGSSLPEVTTDFDGIARGAAPDMGAYEFTYIPLAVSDVNADKVKLSVYPNPFADVLKISDIKGIKSIRINDISGRNLKTLIPAAELDLRDLKTGIYIISFQFENDLTKAIKVIKK